MKKQALLADKLVAGTAIASVSASWWSTHSCSIHSYICAMRRIAARKVLSEKPLQGAKDWDDHVRDDRTLMMRHVLYELALVDAASTGDARAIDRIQGALEENMLDQSRWYALRVDNFPAATFEELMRSHISLFLEAVIHKMDANRRLLAFCERKREHNAVSLGALMAEWV